MVESLPLRQINNMVAEKLCAGPINLKYDRSFVVTIFQSLCATLRARKKTISQTLTDDWQNVKIHQLARVVLTLFIFFL